MKVAGDQVRYILIEGKLVDQAKWKDDNQCSVRVRTASDGAIILPDRTVYGKCES